MTISKVVMSTETIARIVMSTETISKVGNTTNVESVVIRLRRPSGVDPFDVQLIQTEEAKCFPDGGLTAYLVLLGLFMGSVVNLGIINSIGAIQVYVSNHQLAHVSTSSISWIFSIYLCLAYAFSLFTGNIFDRKGPTELLVGSTVLIFAGLMGIASSVQVWHFIVSFIFLGIGNGLGMAPLISVISHWFLKKRGNTTGIATSGGSLGGLLFPLMLRHLYANYGFEMALRIVAFTCLGFMLIAVALVKSRFTRPKKEVAQWPGQVHHSVNSMGLYILRKPKYALLILGGFFAQLSTILLLTYFASYAIAQGVSASNSYLLLTIWNATGVLGSWIPGYFSDIYGRFNINVIMLVLFNICVFSLLLPLNSTGLFLLAGLGGYSLGSIFSLLPACLAQVTPVNEVGTTYGILNACLSLANLFGIPIASAIIGKGTVHDYHNFVILVGVLSVLGTVFWGMSRYTLVGFRMNVKI